MNAQATNLMPRIYRNWRGQFEAGLVGRRSWRNHILEVQAVADGLFFLPFLLQLAQIDCFEARDYEAVTVRVDEAVGIVWHSRLVLAQQSELRCMRRQEHVARKLLLQLERARVVFSNVRIFWIVQQGGSG